MQHPFLLSEMAEEAVDDFESLLRIMGKDALNREDFCNYMNTLGYDNKNFASLAFSRLTAMNPVCCGDTLDGDTLRTLYSSPSYQVCESNVETGREITNYIKSIFREANTSGTGVLGKVELKKCFLGMMMTSQYPEESNYYDVDYNGGDKKVEPLSTLSLSISDSALADDLVAEALKRTGSDCVTLEQLASLLLCYNETVPPTLDKTSFSRAGFDSSTLNPFLYSADEFVTAVEDYVFQHGALNHHLLDTLSKGVYGVQTVDIVARFLEAYQYFSCHFCTYLRHVTYLLPEAHMVDILLENEQEEQGLYDEDDLAMMVTLGLDPELMKGVTHKDLMVQLIDKLKNLSNEQEDSQNEAKANKDEKLQLQAIAAGMVQAFQTACFNKETGTAETGMAAMYFGSELLVNKLYSQICNYLRTADERLSNQDLAFFLLHIDMDVEHARLMRTVVVELCDTQAQREAMVQAVAGILEARVQFYDAFVQHLFPPTGHGGTHSGTLYNKQSSNWVRKKANCLSDFTGRPVIFEMCQPHIRGANVLDVGCGEGYAARKLMNMGASSVTGLDISENMVEKARENATTENENYLVGDARNLKQILEASPTTAGIVPGISTEIGCFDLAVGIFLFNYTSIEAMNCICQQVHHMLKPGGHFVFSVPHPFMLHAHKDNSDSAFGFDKGDATTSAYFSLRDRKFSGTIKTLDGRDLNVKMCFKTISDYMEALNVAGFDISYIEEARVLPEHVSEHPEFFTSVKDSPLHLVFKAKKKKQQLSAQKTNIASSALSSMPQKIQWKPYQFKSPETMLVRTLPAEAKDSLEKVVRRLVTDGITANTYKLNAVDKNALGVSLLNFAANIHQLLAVDTGVVLVRGLPVGSEPSCKLAYYILSSLVGKVDERCRGRLFDVKDTKLRSSEDNVLFSVSNSEASWHTDGASVSKAYDGVSLLCLHPARNGGEIRISNAVNAFESLQARLPKFLMFELLRSVPRDILESGSGKGNGDDVLMNLCRSPHLLKLRVRNNAYPIYVDGGNRMRFRYMRYWIESGHAKAGLELPPFLSIAMDLLDAALDDCKLWEDRMQPGEALYCHNLITAHARNAFTDEPGDAPRHKVRIWLKL